MEPFFSLTVKKEAKAISRIAVVYILNSKPPIVCFLDSYLVFFSPPRPSNSSRF
jgi:hypothetical protein